MAGRGRRVIARLLDERAGTRAVPQSVFETRLFRVLRRARLPLPIAQYSLQTARGRVALDFAYVDHRVGVEADGFLWHSSRPQWDHDRERANALTVLGWTIIRVTWTQLRDQPNEVVDAIRALLDRKR